MLLFHYHVRFQTTDGHDWSLRLDGAPFHGRVGTLEGFSRSRDSLRGRFLLSEPSLRLCAAQILRCTLKDLEKERIVVYYADGTLAYDTDIGAPLAWLTPT